MTLFLGPRFALIAICYLFNRHTHPSSALPVFLSVLGVVRTLTCGGWVYITSSDDHDVHDVLMILYIVLNLPWMLGNIRLSQGKARSQRCVCALAIPGHSHALRTSPSCQNQNCLPVSNPPSANGFLTVDVFWNQLLALSPPYDILFCTTQGLPRPGRYVFRRYSTM